MLRLHLTKKGQATFPKVLRDWLGVKPGEDVAVELEEGGRILLRPPRSGAGLLAKYATPDAPADDRGTERAIGENLGVLDEQTRRHP